MNSILLTNRLFSRLTHPLSPLLKAYHLRPWTSSSVFAHLRNMSTKDVSHQADIAKMKTEPDGSFKRLDASFRNFIEKGSQFEPEKGVF